MSLKIVLLCYILIMISPNYFDKVVAINLLLYLICKLNYVCKLGRKYVDRVLYYMFQQSTRQLRTCLH